MDTYNNIKTIEFEVFGNYIRHTSAFNKKSINDRQIELYGNIEPKKGGLIDQCMLNSNPMCTICGLNIIKCIGHFIAMSKK